MNNSYILCEGYTLDLDQSEPIPITRTIADVMNPAERKKSQTKVFKLAGTQRNMRFFQSMFSLTWSVEDGQLIGLNYDISKLYSATYFFEGRKTFQGALQLLSVKIESGVTFFEVVMFSNVISAFQQWGDLKVAELDWEEYDHTLNETNIQNSWDTSVIVNGSPVSNFTGSTPDGFGYLYGPVDYGFTNILDKFKDSEIIPQIYMREIIVKAYEYLGLTVDETFIGSERFKRLMFGYGGGDKFQLSASDLSDLAYDYVGDGTYNKNTNVSGYGANQYIYSTDWFQMATDINSNFTITATPNDPSSQAGTGRITVPKTGTYRITVNFSVDYDISLRDTDPLVEADISWAFDLFFVKNIFQFAIDVGAGSASVQATVSTASGTHVVSRSVDFFLEAGDEYFLSFRTKVDGDYTNIGAYPGGYTAKGTTLDLDFNNTITIEQQCLNSEIINGSTVYLSSVIPDMKVTTLMKGLINHFGLNVSEPDPDGVVTIEPRVDFYETGTPDVWTKKIDFSEPQEIEPIAINQPKNFAWKFAQDQDYYRKIHADLFGRGYGDYYYENPSFFAKGETVIELPYTISPPVQRTGSNLIIPRIIEMTNGVVKPFKGKPRIYYFQGTDTQSWTLINSDTLAETAQTTIPLLHHLDDTTSPTFDLCFGTPEQVFYLASDYTTINAYTEYLETFTRELTSIDSKLLRASFRLSENDADEDTLRRIKNINGVPYRINQIIDFVPGRSTVVELTKVLDIKKKGTYTIGIGINPKVGQFGTYNSPDTEYGKRTKDNTANVTVSMENNLYNIDTTSGEKTVTLDHRVLRDNFQFNIRKSAGSYDVVITCADGKTLNGQTTQRIRGTLNSFWIKWDGVEFTVN